MALTRDINEKNQLDIFLFRYFELLKKSLPIKIAEYVAFLNEVDESILKSNNFNDYFSLILLLRDPLSPICLYQLEQTVRNQISSTCHALANHIIKFISRSEEYKHKVEEINQNMRALDAGGDFDIDSAHAFWMAFTSFETTKGKLGATDEPIYYLGYSCENVYNTYYGKMTSISYSEFLNHINNIIEVRKAARLVAQLARGEGVFVKLPPEVGIKIAKSVAQNPINDDEMNIIAINNYGR